ncbi:hypothetical protein ACTHPF_17355 [Paenibacillus sp. SAF-054]|uniref:hypothetical protein n=1 Tax=unclassified Paenibacillus TaxID=185978 RepID=UPI003F7D7563
MNRRFTATSIILVLLVLLVSACGGKKAAEEPEAKPTETAEAADSGSKANEDEDIKETSEEVADKKNADKPSGKADEGYLKDGVYTNEYFGMTVQMPQGWEVQGPGELEDVMETGKEIIADGDEDKQKALDKAELKVLNFFLASKSATDSQQMNPNVISNAEKVSKLQVRTAKQYLEASQTMLKQSNLPYEFDDIKSANVGGKEFQMMQATLQGDGVTVTQRYYSTLTDGYALNIITTFFDEASEAETEKMIQSVKFE